MFQRLFPPDAAGDGEGARLHTLGSHRPPRPRHTHNGATWLASSTATERPALPPQVTVRAVEQKLREIRACIQREREAIPKVPKVLKP